MFKRLITGITLGVAVVAVIMNIPFQKSNALQQPQNDFQKIVDFQKEVIPVIEAALKKEFPKETPISDTDTTTDIHSEAFFDQGVYYFENDDVNNQKVVFMVYKEDTKEMQAVMKELQEKLGAKVTFKKAERNPQALRNLIKTVADYVDSIDRGAHSVGYDVAGEQITVVGNFTDEQIADLKAKFGDDVLRITKKTIEGGQQVLEEDVK